MDAKWIFPPVTGDNVDTTLKWTAYAWYGVAALQGLLLLRAFTNGNWAGGDLIGPLVSYLGARALQERKSRAVAAALIGYAGITLLFGIGALLGLAGNNASIILALIALYAAWWAFDATRFWQARHCARMHWARVVFTGTLALFVTLAALIVAWAIKVDMPAFKTFTDFLFAAALFLPPIAVLWAFTRRWPFAGSAPACPWPPKKHA